jgi:hypothetical protein
MQQLFIDTNMDKNIFHVFMMELLEIGRLMNKNISIENLLLTNYDESLSVDLWRTYILQYLVKNIYVTQQLKNNNSIVQILPREFITYRPEMLKIHFQWFNCWSNSNYTEKKDIILFIDKLKILMNIECTLNHVKFINRKNNRQVFDLNTYEPIENELKKYGIQCAYFEDMHPRDQIDFVKDAQILIAPHGAALTNMIFTHKECIICEINLRKFWFCNPICENHKSEKFAIDEDCGQGPPFSKYDYNNMCKLLGKEYYELQTDKYTDQTHLNTMNRNFMLDSKQLVKYIETLKN